MQEICMQKNIYEIVGSDIEFIYGEIEPQIGESSRMHLNKEMRTESRMVLKYFSEKKG